jgi:hypothetical protein
MGSDRLRKSACAELGDERNQVREDRPSRSNFQVTRGVARADKGRIEAAPGDDAPAYALVREDTLQPAPMSASRCKARFWSTVETRAYPISIPYCGAKLWDTKVADFARDGFCPEKGRLGDTRIERSLSTYDKFCANFSLYGSHCFRRSDPSIIEWPGLTAQFGTIRWRESQLRDLRPPP